jgi:hypothetical protein
MLSEKEFEYLLEFYNAFPPYNNSNRKDERNIAMFKMVRSGKKLIEVARFFHVTTTVVKYVVGYFLNVSQRKLDYYNHSGYFLIQPILQKCGEDFLKAKKFESFTYFI